MALSADRNTFARWTSTLGSYKVAASTTIYKGALVSVNSSGYLIPAADTASTKVIGRADEYVDNSAGSDGDLSCKVQAGVFKWANSAGAAIAQSGVGAGCYIEADSIVAATSAQSILAGVVQEIDPDGGIWVLTFPGISTNATISGYPANGLAETVTSGALSVTKRTSRLSITSAKEYTIADGTVIGQRKTIYVTVAASGATGTAAAGTLTPATFADGTTAAFDAVGDELELEWQVGGWIVVHKTSVTVS